MSASVVLIIIACLLLGAVLTLIARPGHHPSDRGPWVSRQHPNEVRCQFASASTDLPCVYYRGHQWPHDSIAHLSGGGTAA